ncbi:hypothetical protein PX52LOC_05526 [Limnoglobus roseus]|uniref:Uncharacterized protein n=1 Tax=Limnoglobus roseus TaxID=2598579 RepID=A0A5C1AI35_9BACT|nr:hypothetical protein PX52LOC_05526 [Limnoglobus roseus]
MSDPYLRFQEFKDGELIPVEVRQSEVNQLGGFMVGAGLRVPDDSDLDERCPGCRRTLAIRNRARMVLLRKAVDKFALEHRDEWEKPDVQGGTRES